MTRIEESMQRRAKDLGISIDELLAHDIERLRNLPVNKNCLHPSFLDNMKQPVLDMLAHVLTCPSCAAQVVMLHEERTKA